MSLCCSLPERVLPFCSSKQFYLFFKHNFVSTLSPGNTVKKPLAMFSALAGRIFIQMSQKRSVSTAS